MLKTGYSMCVYETLTDLAKEIIFLMHQSTLIYLGILCDLAFYFTQDQKTDIY